MPTYHGPFDQDSDQISQEAAQVPISDAPRDVQSARLPSVGDRIEVIWPLEAQ